MEQHIRLEEKPGERAVVRPNMGLSNVSATSSTFAQVDFDHCAFLRAKYFNSLFALTDLRSSTFTRCSFDGAVFKQSTLRGVRMENCDIRGLVINGVEIDTLIAGALRTRGRGKADE